MDTKQTNWIFYSPRYGILYSNAVSLLENKYTVEGRTAKGAKVTWSFKESQLHEAGGIYNVDGTIAVKER